MHSGELQQLHGQGEERKKITADLWAKQTNSPKIMLPQRAGLGCAPETWHAGQACARGDTVLAWALCSTTPRYRQMGGDPDGGPLVAALLSCLWGRQRWYKNCLRCSCFAHQHLWTLQKMIRMVSKFSFFQYVCICLGRLVECFMTWDSLLPTFPYVRTKEDFYQIFLSKQAILSVYTLFLHFPHKIAIFFVCCR